MEYLKKILSPRPRHRKARDWKFTLWSAVGVFLSIIVLYWAIHHLGAPSHGFILIGSFGASAVMILALPAIEASQPRSVLGGHVLSALCGVAAASYLPTEPAVSAALAVGAALLIMDLTDTLHPPGGATALLAVIDHSQIDHLGFAYALAPVGVGALVLIIMGLLINNIKGTYPAYWW